jgi:hypothetical protein
MDEIISILHLERISSEYKVIPKTERVAGFPDLLQDPFNTRFTPSNRSRTSGSAS